ncbi:MAG: peptide-methionine (S)-S-oxide reductase MsrA [Spirochaetota bacterium]
MIRRLTVIRSTGLLALLLLVLSPATLVAAGASEPAAASGERSAEAEPNERAVPEDAATAVFAGGCFWCMEEAYEKVPGVYEAVSGYAGGDVPDPSYRQVTGGSTGHYEVVRVFYNPDELSYEDLLSIFWRNVDPLDSGGQFCDRGSSYKPAIFYRTDDQERLARESRRRLEESGRFSRPIVVEILELDAIEDDENDGFWVAEEYHQDYYLKNPVQYNFYKNGCGRVRRLEQLWGDEAGAPSFVEES